MMASRRTVFRRKFTGNTKTTERKSIQEYACYKRVNKDIRDLKRNGGSSAAVGGESRQHPDLLIREISQTSRERSQFRSLKQVFVLHWRDRNQLHPKTVNWYDDARVCTVYCNHWGLSFVLGATLVLFACQLRHGIRLPSLSITYSPR